MVIWWFRIILTLFITLRVTLDRCLNMQKEHLWQLFQFLILCLFCELITKFTNSHFVTLKDFRRKIILNCLLNLDFVASFFIICITKFWCLEKTLVKQVLHRYEVSDHGKLYIDAMALIKFEGLTQPLRALDVKFSTHAILGYQIKLVWLLKSMIVIEETFFINILLRFCTMFHCFYGSLRQLCQMR